MKKLIPLFVLVLITLAACAHQKSPPPGKDGDLNFFLTQGAPIALGNQGQAVLPPPPPPPPGGGANAGAGQADRLPFRHIKTMSMFDAANLDIPVMVVHYTWLDGKVSRITTQLAIGSTTTNIDYGAVVANVNRVQVNNDPDQAPQLETEQWAFDNAGRRSGIISQTALVTASYSYFGNTPLIQSITTGTLVVGGDPVPKHSLTYTRNQDKPEQVDQIVFDDLQAAAVNNKKADYTEIFIYNANGYLDHVDKSSHMDGDQAEPTVVTTTCVYDVPDAPTIITCRTNEANPFITTNTMTRNADGLIDTLSVVTSVEAFNVKFEYEDNAVASVAPSSIDDPNSLLVDLEAGTKRGMNFIVDGIVSPPQ